MGKPRRNPLSSTLPPSAPRLERKIIEKNRRNRMKTLFSDLISLLPDHTSEVEGLPLPNQIDAAVEYTKSLNAKLEKLREKKELLLQGKRSSESCTAKENQAINKRSPQIEVHDMGPNLDVIVANGLQNYSSFHDIIKLTHQHGQEITSANFASDGSSTIQVLQDKVGQSKSDFEGETMSRKLKDLVCGTSSSSSEIVESEKLWDYEIDSNIWVFEIPQALPAATNCGYYEEFLNMEKLFM